VRALHAAAADELSLLPGLLRLLDCLVLQSGLELVRAAVGGIGEHLARGAARAEVEVSMGRDGPCFSPSQEEFVRVRRPGCLGAPRAR
jgi:hypothetical protein